MVCVLVGSSVCERERESGSGRRLQSLVAVIILVVIVQILVLNLMLMIHRGTRQGNDDRRGTADGCRADDFHSRCGQFAGRLVVSHFLGIAFLVAERFSIVDLTFLFGQRLPVSTELLCHLSDFPVGMTLLNIGTSVMREEEKRRQCAFRCIRVFFRAFTFAHRVLTAISGDFGLITFSVLLR